MEEDKFNLEWVKKFLEDKWHNIFYVAVYGSQNYNLDTAESDVDYKAIILPKLDDIIENSKPFSSTYEFGWGLIDVKDIRAYIDSAVKCNINFIEILNTPYFIGSDKLRKFFIPLQETMGKLYLKACYWMMLEKYEALRHPYPSIVHKIEKFWYDPKQLHHIVRLRILMDRFVKWDIWNFLHNWDERIQLIWLKVGDIPSLWIDEIANLNIEYAKKIRDEYLVEPIFDVKYDMIEEGRKIIKESIIEEIKLSFDI